MSDNDNKMIKVSRKRKLQLVNPPPSREERDAKRQNVLEGKEIDDSVVIIVIGTKNFQNLPAEGAQCIVLWPGGRAGYVLDDEIHFVLYNYVYIVHRDFATFKGVKTLRNPEKAKGYTGSHDLLHVCGGVISAEALACGEEMDIESYKAKYIDKLWLPTSKEYHEAMIRHSPKPGFSKLL